MSEENVSEVVENTEGSQTEQGSSEQVQEGTQQASTGEQVDASQELRTNGSEVGLQKKESEGQVESGEDFSKGLNSLVDLALNGELSEDQRAALDAQGLGDHFDMIVSGHKANIEKNDAEIVGVVGSKEAYGELQEWALSNLDDADIESYNMAVIESGNVGLAKLAVEGLQARYLRENGQAPSKRIEAGGTANEATRPYANVNDYINETMSTKYRQDPEYASQVEAKRNLSGF